jgi:hypothetical protein
MIVVNHTYLDGKIQPERELKKEELNYISIKIKPNCIEYFYDSDVVEDVSQTLTAEQLNEMQYIELQPTDWYFVRKVELGVDVPNEVILERLAIRKKYDDLKNGI